MVFCQNGKMNCLKVIIDQRKCLKPSFWSEPWSWVPIIKKKFSSLQAGFEFSRIYVYSKLNNIDKRCELVIYNIVQNITV